MTENKQHKDIERALHESTPTIRPAFQQSLEDDLLTRLHDKHHDKEQYKMVTMQSHIMNPPYTSRFTLPRVAAIFVTVLLGAVLMMLNLPTPPTIHFGGAIDPPEQTLCNPRMDWQQTYTVQEGDTLRAIADKHNTNPDTLVQANCLGNNALVNVGDSLRVPDENTCDTAYDWDSEHTIRQGETLFSIARDYNIDPQELMAANCITATLLEVGDTLRVPFDSVADAMIPIIVAAQDIPMGTIITEDMVYRTNWSHADATTILQEMRQDNANTGWFGNVSDVLGAQASTFISRFEPITSEQVRPDFPCDQQPCLVMPNNNLVAVNLPINALDSAALSLQAGQTVDVITTLLYVDIADESQELDNESVTQESAPSAITQRMVTNAIVMQVGGSGRQDDAATEPIIMLAVSSRDAVMLTYLAEAQAPMFFVPHIEVTRNIPQDESEVYETIAITVPISNRMSSTMESGDAIGLTVMRDLMTDDMPMYEIVAIGLLVRINDDDTLVVRVPVADVAAIQEVIDNGYALDAFSYTNDVPSVVHIPR